MVAEAKPEGRAGPKVNGKGQAMRSSPTGAVAVDPPPEPPRKKGPTVQSKLMKAVLAA